MPKKYVSIYEVQPEEKTYFFELIDRLKHLRGFSEAIFEKQRITIKDKNGVGNFLIRSPTAYNISLVENVLLTWFYWKPVGDYKFKGFSMLNDFTTITSDASFIIAERLKSSAPAIIPPNVNPRLVKRNTVALLKFASIDDDFAVFISEKAREIRETLNFKFSDRKEVMLGDTKMRLVSMTIPLWVKLALRGKGVVQTDVAMVAAVDAMSGFEKIYNELRQFIATRGGVGKWN